jgi:epoxyqueuosine reductase QueG
MDKELKSDVVDHLRSKGAFDVRIADPHIGFEHALPGQHPLELWNECRSIVVFAVTCPPRTNNLYFGPYAPWHGEWETIGEISLAREDAAGSVRSGATGPVPQIVAEKDFAMVRLVVLFLSFITMEGVGFLQSRGHSGGPVALYPVLSKLQRKLCAFESGMGVYGRSGLILHPILGNRARYGAIFTDVVLEPDGRLEGFEPCVDCDRCITMCPANAYDSLKEYPQSWSREKCTAKRKEIASSGLYCHNCLAVCPAGKIEDTDLLRMVEAKSIFNADQ